MLWLLLTLNFTHNSQRCYIHTDGTFGTGLGSSDRTYSMLLFLSATKSLLRFHSAMKKLLHPRDRSTCKLPRCWSCSDLQIDESSHSKCNTVIDKTEMITFDSMLADKSKPIDDLAMPHMIFNSPPAFHVINDVIHLLGCWYCLTGQQEMHLRLFVQTGAGECHVSCLWTFQ